MSRGHNRAHRFGGYVDNCIAICKRSGRAARRARDRAFQIAADVRERNSGVGSRLGFQCPLLDSAINLAQVVDAGILLRGGAGPNEVRNGNRRQKADDGHDDHDFHQGEPGFARGVDLHIVLLTFLSLRREPEQRAGYYNYGLFTYCSLQPCLKS